MDDLLEVVISNIRHINPFCDFEPKEVGPIIRSLNSMEFDGGSDDTGKIRRVKGLMHYYQVTSENGTVVTVTAEMGKWVYVSDKRLQAAKARSITGGLGNLISNTARSLINKIGNINNAKRGISGAINNIVQGEAPEGAGSDLVRARNYRGSGVLSSLATGFSKLKGMFSSGGDGGLGDIGNTLLGGSGDSKPSDTSSIEAKSIDGLSIGSFLKKINSTKFDPNKYLKTSGENAGKNMSNKEVREAERQKQSTLNIFRQSNFTEEQISRKMDVIISGLFGSSGGGKSKGGVFGIGGLFGNLLSGIAMSALGIGSLMALRDGKFDGLLEGLYGTVNGDNTGTNNTKSKYSSVTATDKKTGKTYQLATKKGKIVEDENGNYVTPDGQILNPEDFTVNYRGSMGFGQKMPYLAFKQFTKHGTTMFSPLRRLAINGLSRIPLLGRPFRGLNNTIDSLAVKGRNKFLEGFSKLPGVNKLVSNIGDSKFGQWLTKMGAKKMSKEAEVLTRNKFNQFFGRNGAKKFKEFQQKGLEQFLTDNPIAAQNAEKLFAEADENLLQKAGKEAGQEGTEKGFKKFLSMFSKETVTETAKEGMEKGTKEVAEEGLEKGAKKAAGITMSEAIKQAASGATEKVAKETLENATEKAAKETLFSTMKDLFESFFKKLSTNKLARKVLGNNVEEFGEEFTQKVVKEAAEKIYAKAGINAAQQAVGAIPIAGWIISVGFAIIEFEENWNRAARIFKVTNPTILERFVAGLVAAVQELIGDLLHFPIDFVPTEWLINGTIWVLEKCGVPFKDLKARQEQAQRELDEFNAKHSDMEPVTFEQWAHMTKAEGGLGESTLGERAFGGIKSAWQNGKVAVKSSWNRSKEQVKGAWEKGKSIAGEAIDRVKEVFDGIKDTFNKVMEVAKSSIGSIFKARQDIMEIARTGDLTKLTDYDTTSAIDKDNPLSGIITAINVIQKLIGYPYTGIAYVGNKIKEKFDQVSGVIKATWDLYTSVDARVAEYSNAGDVKGLVGASIETTEDNPLGGIMKGMLFASKVLRFIPACTTNLSNKVKEKFDQISGVIKATWDLYTSVDAKVMEYSDAGDVKGLVNASIEVDENNPLSGVMKGMLFTSKVLRFVPTGFKYIGNKVHDFISSKVEDVKSNIDSISSEFERMSENAQEGNVLGIWSTPISPYNKLSITGSMFNTANLIGKIFYTLIGLARKLMKPIGEAAEYVGEKVEGAKEWVIEKKDNAVSKVKEVGTNIKEGDADKDDGSNTQDKSY